MEKHSIIVSFTIEKNQQYDLKNVYLCPLSRNGLVILLSTKKKNVSHEEYDNCDHLYIVDTGNFLTFSYTVTNEKGERITGNVTIKFPKNIEEMLDHEKIKIKISDIDILEKTNKLIFKNKGVK